MGVCGIVSKMHRSTPKYAHPLACPPFALRNQQYQVLEYRFPWEAVYGSPTLPRNMLSGGQSMSIIFRVAMSGAQRQRELELWRGIHRRVKGATRWEPRFPTR